MHAELRDFFDTHAASTAKHRAATNAQIDTILDVTHAAQAHVQTLRAQLRKAMSAPHDPSIDGKLTYLKTRLKSYDDAVAVLLTAAEEVTRIGAEVENAFAPATQQIAGLLERSAAHATADAGPGSLVGSLTLT